MNNPLVSVLIPVFNAGDYLRASLQSILSQTYTNLEILIIDDGSTDGGIIRISDIKDDRIRIIRQENSGRAMAMNNGLEKMSGEFYIAQDADDISYPTRIEEQLNCMLKNPNLVAVFVGHDLLINNKIVAPRFSFKNSQECRRDINNFRMPGIGATAMYRMSMISDVRFESSLRVAEDVDYILRIGELYDMMLLDKCLYTYRIHSCSSTKKDKSRNIQMTNEVIKRACLRRKLSPENYIRPLRESDYRPVKISRDVIPHFMESVIDHKSFRKIYGALETSIECIKLCPYDLMNYKPLLYCLLPLKIIKYYRKIKDELSVSV